MARSLVIVESPAKAKTIGKFLGKNYVIKASMGHVMDLPRSQFGVDVEHGFRPKYITIRGKGKILKELREAAKKADKIYLATDPDREGEAISWHLAQALELNNPSRIVFHEITKRAIEQAIKNPRGLDMPKVNAQQARRILDRLVGYELSPLLWAKIRRGLSAGRVQSAAVRLITDREAEINNFQPEEYWSITGDFLGNAKEVFQAKLSAIDGKKAEIGDGETAQKIVAAIKTQKYRVGEVKRKERLRYPAPPFTTSTLQQEAARKLGFSSRKTMSIAQQLYEGLELGEEGSVGLVTYIRTDSVRIAEEAAKEAAEVIRSRYPEALPERPPVYKTKSSTAQEAHEAIRPTSTHRHPSSVKPFLTRDQYRLYQLIWNRFVASQMRPAVYDTVSADIVGGKYTFRATGSTLKLPGFLVLYQESADEEGEAEEGMLPELKTGEPLTLQQVTPKQHFTQPPPRYTEAMLVKTLEELGIGRPSTYAPIIETILKRNYVTLEEKRFRPTELGQVVVDLLKEHFPEIVDLDFTAEMEEELDRIEEGDSEWVGVLENFYRRFNEELTKAKEQLERVSIADEVSEEVCELCGRKMVYKFGRFGKFLACPGYPECKNTKPIRKEVNALCPVCGGAIVERRTKKGRRFYGCANYPSCNFTRWEAPAGPCPSCGSFTVVQRKDQENVMKCLKEDCGYEGPVVKEEKDQRES
ncbi:MAG TPA: type I DNA topoisomerase [Firmicutes bacterium]|nr:type I DNA topoisomerase [Bacillota bacterium]HOQ23587.1 type I DNA topoisomerase [Bacillota bacterium]HPT67240.1 type I DNA topoisomerase [Bacillota bacterium]